MALSEDDRLLREFYDRRAPEYDRRELALADPVYKDENAIVHAAMKKLLAGRRVLEVACGNGFWTAALAEIAESVVATDVSKPSLDLARRRLAGRANVEFRLGDAYALEAIPGLFDAAVVNFWFSHVPRARTTEFLQGLHRRVGAGAVVFLADNVYVQGRGGSLITVPDLADTYKLRTLSDGSQYRIIKNYYSAEELDALFRPFGTDLCVHTDRSSWWASYRTR